MSDLLAKFILIFAIGAGSGILALKIFTNSPMAKIVGIEPPSSNTPKVQILGDQTGQNLQQQAIDSGQNLLNQAVSSLTNGFSKNAAAQPIVKTSQDVQQAADDMKNLSQDQKNAICKQICN